MIRKTRTSLLFRIKRVREVADFDRIFGINKEWMAYAHGKENSQMD